jgi:outer membrane beta-barrel protein
MSTAAFAQDTKKTPVKKDSDKVDISDLEQKYWAPKDTDFSVVQNRTYTKAGKIFVSAQGGPLVNDQYSEGLIYGGSLNYFFNERYGVQATYLGADLHNNDWTKNLTQFGSGVQPDFGRFKNYYGLGFNFVPFYAKMSFLGSRILYFDMAITPTVGMTSYDQVMLHSSANKSSFTYGLDITQYFFFTKNFAIRADLKNQWFKEEVRSYKGNGGAGLVEGDKVRDQNTQFTTFLLGLTLYFN